MASSSNSQNTHHSQQQPFVQPGEPLNEFLRSFWQRQITTAEEETPDYRHPPLPLARIKKVMKSDPDVKACEIFIAEITARAFIVADSNKRRTLSRADIAKALSKSDQFDFLIDIVPREEANFPVPLNGSGTGASGGAAGAGAGAAGGAAGTGAGKKGQGQGQGKQDQAQNGDDAHTHAHAQADVDDSGTGTGGGGSGRPGSSKEVLDQLESLLGSNGAGSGSRGSLS
ncbi:Nuclear transcription factor Y subunit C-2 [Psilocybe cubensis]|uniref:Nuclear transcription factor Y subunit C-2 n=1 Tax=Psilocybe cubensis TaxID=181762 RepID=A0ACB8H5P1_PSICU|nr:Nuclear transcription factor Y subunit C-2 [Psilocybe cubensis]KAH9483295.1 Nuclear transcription factor Y subunit C-2 [Psilocybe cubensis]